VVVDAVATGPEDFETALRRLQIPLFNVLYADRDGHIFYLFNGRVPVRPRGDFEEWTTKLAPGDTDALIW
jgi:acyl-homoserine-lactone acylase